MKMKDAIAKLARNKRKAEIDKMKYHIGTLNLEKELVENMFDSGDSDFIKLAEHNGKDVRYQVPVQPAILRELLSIYLPDFDMTLKISQIKERKSKR